MNDGSLQSKIRAWLQKQGFPLELKVAKAFQESGFNVLQSSYYTDFEEQKPRETDVIASTYSYYEPPSGAFINELETYAVVECKSTDKPWVNFRGSPIPHWTADLFLTNKCGKRLVSDARTKAGATELLTTKKYCYSAALAFVDEGRAFAAMMSVMKAAESLFEQKCALDKEKPRSRDAPIYAPIVHAVVVTSSPLFECSVNEDYELNLREVPSSAVALQYPRQRQGSGSALVINVVSESNLSGFITQVRGSHEAAASQLEHLRARLRDA